MADPEGPPAFREFSPSMRVDVMIADWRAALDPELTSEQKEGKLYGEAWAAYQEGDFGFGLWCWHECDRLTNALNGSVREVTRVLGPGRYFGYSHRKVVAEKVPIDRIYRPRKGDMSTPRPDAFVLPVYQILCVYAVRAAVGDTKAKALLEIALGESEDRRRADPYMKHFETFQRLLDRSKAPGSPPATAGPLGTPSPPPTEAPPTEPARPPSKPRSTNRRAKGT
jgi:hypothetical protein